MFDVMTQKPGNVHFAYSFDHMTAIDFLLSAAAIAPVMEQAPLRRVGETILDSIRATRRVTSVNTNLGIVLLLAPLASVPPNLDLRGGVMRASMRLTVEDARNTYEAIRLAKPGGLGTVEHQDVAGEPTVTLREAMALAADRDLIARQYVNDFEQVFEGAEILRENIGPTDTEIETAVVRTFLRILAKNPDSLIERKYGRAAAQDVSNQAREIVESKAGYSHQAITGFDVWLRQGCSYPYSADSRSLQSEHIWESAAPNARNPGTTADLITASLFVALRRGIIQLPLPRPQSESPAG
jgi:triphosphoribosyl-dephospho-CoA synthase